MATRTSEQLLLQLGGDLGTGGLGRADVARLWCDAHHNAVVLRAELELLLVSHDQGLKLGLKPAIVRCLLLQRRLRLVQPASQ